MSLASINNMIEAFREEEDAIDSLAEIRQNKRMRKVNSQEEYNRLFSRLWKMVNNLFNIEYINPKKGIYYDAELHLELGGNNEVCPNHIVDSVIASIKARGFEAKHIYNDGYNYYDQLVIGLPSNYLKLLWEKNII